MRNPLAEWADAVVAAKPGLQAARASVENELLAMAAYAVIARHDLLPSDATFIGGTALRFCHGSPRLSEDLDFHTPSFAPRTLDRALLKRGMEEVVGCEVSVSTPTSPTRSTLARISAILPDRPRNTPRPRTKIDLGAGRVLDAKMTIVQLPAGGGVVPGLGDVGELSARPVSSTEEILADKHLALVGRAKRVKNRDVFDILWLHHQGVRFDAELVAAKLADRANRESFTSLLRQRADAVRDAIGSGAYHAEMSRFLPADSQWLLTRNGRPRVDIAEGAKTLVLDHAAVLERTLSREVAQTPGGLGR